MVNPNDQLKTANMAKKYKIKNGPPRTSGATPPKGANAKALREMGLKKLLSLKAKLKNK